MASAAVAATSRCPSPVLTLTSVPHLELDILQGNLLAHLSEKPDRVRRRHIHATQHQRQRTAHESRISFGHFAIQRETHVRIQLLLKLKQLLFATVPWSRFKHDKLHAASG